MDDRVSVAQILRGKLPASVTGVRWIDNRWTECRSCLESYWWRSLAPRYPTSYRRKPTGLMLYGPVTCDACAEGAASRERGA